MVIELPLHNLLHFFLDGPQAPSLSLPLPINQPTIIPTPLATDGGTVGRRIGTGTIMLVVNGGMWTDE